jgi:two-component system response regulator HydG
MVRKSPLCSLGVATNTENKDLRVVFLDRQNASNLSKEDTMNEKNVGFVEPNVSDLSAIFANNVMNEQLNTGCRETALRVLVVDDDQQIQKACSQIAMSRGAATAFSVGTLADARSALQSQKVDLLLLDLKLPDGGGLILLEEVKAQYPETSVVVMTAFATVSSAVEAMRIGARDYLTKPFALEELAIVLDRAARRAQLDRESRLLRERLGSLEANGELVGRSPEMEKVYRILSKVAFSTHPVLILGENGTGKELVARSIHFNGPHLSRPFIPIDCRSLMPSQVEGELFGYVKGAFPGASRAKEGLLAASVGGTVFLDEIGELSLDLQLKLLRALQEKEVKPIGGTNFRAVSVRILASTSRDLIAMVEQGKFRKDLFFRLNVVNLKIPPLRERRGDIPLLAMRFLALIERETGIARTLSDDTIELMVDYDWPGNVTELENAIQQACALSNESVLHLCDMPSQLRDLKLQAHAQLDTQTTDNGTGEPSNQTGEGEIVSIAEMERQAILGTIRQLNGDKLLAAKLLGIGKTTLYRKLREYGIGLSEDDFVFSH